MEGLDYMGCASGNNTKCGYSITLDGGASIWTTGQSASGEVTFTKDGVTCTNTVTVRAM